MLHRRVIHRQKRQGVHVEDPHRLGTRLEQEAVALVHKFDGEFPKKYFREFLDYLDIDEAAFWRVVDRYRSPHLWEKVSGEWRLKYRVQNL